MGEKFSEPQRLLELINEILFSLTQSGPDSQAARYPMTFGREQRESLARIVILDLFSKPGGCISKFFGERTQTIRLILNPQIPFLPHFPLPLEFDQVQREPRRIAVVDDG